MLNEQAIDCHSGKKIPCKIDTVCLHGDGKTAIELATKLKTGLIEKNFKLKTLDKIKRS